MKHLFSTLFVVFFATSMMAQTGLSCEDPIPVDKSYTAHVNAGDELWYTASTWDLPMHVYFSPDVDNSTWGPEVQIDFTCKYGDYSHDYKLDSVINILKVLGVTLPVEFYCEEVIRNGKIEWDLSIDERYRDQLTEYGLTHNVQAFVKVYFPDGGKISLTPDPTFQDCMENGHYAKLSDTIEIAANDSNKMIVLPYSEWKDEEVRFVWVGEKPARLWVAEDECTFTPTDASVFVKAKYDLDANTNKVLTPADMQAAIDNWIGAGVFYGKVLSDAPGKLVIERIPLGEIQGDAILLKHGEPVQLQANDDRVFCFPKTWKSTEFLANTQYLMAMHVSNTPEFEPGDANVISKYAFSKDGNKRELQLSKGDISNLGASAADDYLYVRFVCNQSAQLTPSLWNVSSCLENTILITSGETFVKAADNKTVYRMSYEDWANYNFTVQWGQTGTLSMHIASYCNFMSTDTDKLKTVVVPAKKSTEVKASDVDSWASSIENEGFLYVLLEANKRGPITVTSAKPAETDPEGPVLDPIYTYDSATVCFADTYEWNGQTYTESGEYIYTTVAANGADSIVTLDLTVLPEVPVTNEKAAICYGEAYTWHGQEYTASGEDSVTLQDVNGCDSVIVLTLTVYPQTPATTEEVTVKFGETYEWNGVVYNESGEYTITLQDENGCDYQATLILTVLPEEKPVSPCVAASTLLEPVAELTLNLGNAFDIYRIDYQAWLASGVNLVWTGKGALHTFVAKDCEFAVAIYHKDVVNYTEVPAEGNVVLSKDILAPLAQYVDVDGYLYVRFLTELEGQLTTALAE